MEFVEQVVQKHVRASTHSGFDKINYYSHDEKPPKMPTEFNSMADMVTGARSLTAPGTGFLKHIVEGGVNVIHLRAMMPDGKYEVFTLVVNRWHTNVNSLFNEDERLDSSKDTLDIIPGLIGSYPSAFVSVNYKDLPDFFDMLANFRNNQLYDDKLLKYFVARSDENFWETFDWFQNYFNTSDPLQAGLLDLNRYYRSSAVKQ